MAITTHLAGLQFRPIKAQVRKSSLQPWEDLNLVPEPDNPHDSNAVQVHTLDGHFIGFVPKSHSAEVAAALKSDDAVCVWNGDGLNIYSQQEYEEFQLWHETEGAAFQEDNFKSDDLDDDIPF